MWDISRVKLFPICYVLQATRTSTSTTNTSQSGPIPAPFGAFGLPAGVHIQTIPATNIGKLLQLSWPLIKYVMCCVNLT